MLSDDDVAVVFHKAPPPKLEDIDKAERVTPIKKGLDLGMNFSNFLFGSCNHSQRKNNHDK